MSSLFTSRQRALAVASAIVLAAACSAANVDPPFYDGKLALGTWGGENAGMIVGDTAMHVHVGCTFGDVSGRVPVGLDGRFDVAGSYMLRAYPIQVGPTVPARFVGQTNGVTATVTITVDDTVTHKTVIEGPIVVTFGVQPRMGPCPICRRPIITKRR